MPWIKVRRPTFHSSGCYKNINSKRAGKYLVWHLIILINICLISGRLWLLFMLGNFFFSLHKFRIFKEQNIRSCFRLFNILNKGIGTFSSSKDIHIWVSLSLPGNNIVATLRPEERLWYNFAQLSFKTTVKQNKKHFSLCPNF